jgi:hypothetical protein
MKKLFLLAFVVLMVLILLHRQRVFVRDPLATVYKSQKPVDGKSQKPGQTTEHADVADGVKQDGVQVYINYSNDVLLARDDEPGAYRILVQHWNKMPGTPIELKCIHSMACLTDADHASTIPINRTATRNYEPNVTMSEHEVSFIAGDGSTMRVVLR